MIRSFANLNASGFEWIDILEPTIDELEAVAKQYNIHDAFVADIMQPEHLPKYESLGETSFFILRYYAVDDNEVCDTIQELTNKIAIFYAENILITIHKYEANFIYELKKDLLEHIARHDAFHFLNRLIKYVIQSYEAPAIALSKQIDFYESKTFLQKNPPPIVKGLYHVKRKIEVTKKVLILSRDILEKIDSPDRRNPETRDTRDLYIRILTLYESMSDITNHLLTVYFSIASQRTNEVIRVLTVFSVFFMPLTFIVGIYGMNFEFMPELKWKLGYPAIMLFMLGVTFAIYQWFRRKGWL